MPQTLSVELHAGFERRRMLVGALLGLGFSIELLEVRELRVASEAVESVFFLLDFLHLPVKSRQLPGRQVWRPSGDGERTVPSDSLQEPRSVVCMVEGVAALPYLTGDILVSRKSAASTTDCLSRDMIKLDSLSS